MPEIRIDFSLTWGRRVEALTAVCQRLSVQTERDIQRTLRGYFCMHQKLHVRIQKCKLCKGVVRRCPTEVSKQCCLHVKLQHGYNCAFLFFYICWLCILPLPFVFSSLSSDAAPPGFKEEVRDPPVWASVQPAEWRGQREDLFSCPWVYLFHWNQPVY